MLKPWRSRIIQIAGTLALVALTVIVYRRTDWSKGFTPDGIMTLIAGVLAFAAVQWQMWDQRESLRQEQMRQSRAVAKAVLFEINNFYCYYVRDVQAFLKGQDVLSCKMLGIKSIPSDAFPIYRGNAITVGVLEDDMVGNIVGFYSTAEAYLSILRDYRIESERYYQQGGDKVAEEKARTFLGQVKSTGPEITKLIHVLSEELCKVASVQFRAPIIAVAAEDLATEKIAASLEGGNAQKN